jgi:hypothetical protein
MSTPTTNEHDTEYFSVKSPKGRNSYILGSSGSGKTTYISGVIANNLIQDNSDRKQYTNIVVVDLGHSYHGLCKIIADSQYVPLALENQNTLAPMQLTEKQLTVFELEEIRYDQNSHIAAQIIVLLKKVTNKQSLVILDEYWMANKAIKSWALTEFEGDSLVCVQSVNDIAQDKAFHLFDHSLELKRTVKRNLHSVV